MYVYVYMSEKFVNFSNSAQIKLLQSDATYTALDQQDFFNRVKKAAMFHLA